MEASAAMGPEASRTDSVEPDYRAFSSIEATDDGRIIYWGGGHSNYGGNDMDVYHIAANEWRQETQEENWKKDLADWDHLGRGDQPTKEQVEKSYNTGPTPRFLTGRGRPGTTHSYQQMTWWPEKGWFCFAIHRLWCWNPEQGDANGSFQQFGEFPRTSQSVSSFNLTYDPSLGTLVTFREAGDKDVRVLRDGDWVKWMDVDSFSGAWGEVFSEYHPADRVHYVSVWSDLHVVDLEDKTSRDIPDSPPQAAGNNGMWIEYSPSREQMLVMGFDESGLGLWGYEPSTSSWDRIAITGSVERGGGNAITNDDMRWDMLERDPISGNFFFLAINKGAPWAEAPVYGFRLSDTVGESTPVDPSPHPTNQWVSLKIPDNPAALPNGNGKDFQMEWRPSDGKVYIGFGDWLQNDGTKHNGNNHLLAFEGSTNTWEVAYDYCTGDPQPEGWDEVAMAYDSKRDELWGFPGFGWKTDKCDTDIGAKTMAYEFGTGTWRVTGHGHLYKHDDTGFAGYDPVTDRFYVAQRPGVDEIDPERPAAGILASYSSGTDYHVGRNQAFLDALGRGLYLTARKQQKLVRFDLDHKSFQEVSGIPEGTVASNAYGFWDPNHRVILAPIGKESNRTGRVHVYHVDLARWQIMDYPDDGTTPFGNSVGYDVDSQLLLQFGTKAYPELRQVFALEYFPQTTGTVEPWVPSDTEASRVKGQTVQLTPDRLP